MITTVTLNPALDITLELNRVVLDRYNQVEKVNRVPGGQGINISKAIRAYGLDTMALGFLGGHAGHYIAEQLREDGITTNFWHIEEETRTNIIIIEHQERKHTLLSDPGPKITKQDLERFKSVYSRVMAQSKIVALAGSLPSDVPADIYHQLIHIAHEKGVYTILNASGAPFEAGLEAKPLLAKPDLRASADWILNKRVNGQETAIQVANEIVERGIQIAVISYEDTRDIIATPEQVWSAESKNQKVANIIGTSEAVIAGFAIKLVEEEREGLPDMIRFAMACGLASALTEDEEFHTREEIFECLPCIELKRLK